MTKWMRPISWLYARRRRMVRLLLRVAMFYAGYRILHHEIYETPTSEPMLVFVGLWLCGLGPAAFLDELRRVGVSVQSQLEESIDATPHEKEAPPSDG